MPYLGGIVTPFNSGTIVWPGTNLNVQRWINIAKMTLASSKAKFCPMQFLGPAANGRYANGWANFGLRPVAGLRIHRL
jgi:hypothetical protein